MRSIETPNMPKSNGHYSTVMEHNGILYISGQLPLDPISRLKPATFKEEVELVFKKLDLILNEAGSSKHKVLQMRIFLSDIELWPQMNELYAAFFENHKPARIVVPSPALHYGCSLEIEATAFV
ncbi:MAG TPA: enamine deaminase RidA [Bacteroidales bacterium]|nr:enamine deaminase RidA [Bacteroidales bacterium]